MSLPTGINVIVLGLLQGLTEFLPVSSSGHQVVAQHVLPLEQTALTFDLALHLGTLAAVFLYFRRDLLKLVREPLEPVNRRWILGIVLASIPTALVGLCLREHVQSFFGRPGMAAAGISLTGLFLLFSARRRIHRPLPHALSALMIGFAQSWAILPGISRSGWTIGLALMLAWPREEAFRFSFLLSIPAIMGASALEALHLQSLPHPGYLFLGMCVAFLTGLWALRWLRALVLREGFHRFGWYCVPAGIIFFLFLP